jgi:HEAT repeat protein
MILLPTLLLLFPTASPVSVPAPQEAGPPTAQETIEAFVDLVKDKDKTVEVQAAIERLVRLYQASLAEVEEIQLKLARKQGSAEQWKRDLRDGKRLRAQLAYEVWKVFRFRTRSHQANRAIWRKALWAFGQMPEHGSDYLWRAFEDKRYNKDSSARAECIKQIGVTKDYTQYDDLIELLQHHDYGVIAAAATALGQFADAPGKVRWECVKELVKKLESYSNDANTGGSTQSGRRYGRTRRPMMRSLENLTGQVYDNSLGWTRFWNKNKRNRKLWKD